MSVSTEGDPRVALEDILTIADLESAAREAVPHLFGALYGSVGDPLWRTNSNNVAALNALPLRPRVMTGIVSASTATTVLGQEIALPVIAAPSGSHQRVHIEGELATARGTHEAGALMALSSVSNYSIEEVGEATPGPKWFQLYIFRDRDVTADLVRRAKAAGYTGIVVTVDNISARLSANLRLRAYKYSWAEEAKFSRTLDPERVLRNLARYEVPDRSGPLERQALRDYFDPSVSWSDIEWLRSISDLPVILKGIQTSEDAVLAEDHGADAIVVSNHGGTTIELDGQPGSLTLLPEVVAAVSDSTEVYFDGGIRSGRDVLKACALGARAVLIGRVVHWGIAVGGAEGLAKAFGILKDELEVAMVMCGVADVRDIDRRVVGTTT